ncbi:hypothetical protein B1C78_15315 [Thioalkalivibrio denitrificans]|uniref:DUF5666 domain-containing protein n=1 Tax=Thioalkalivibrio denitrificans TaxID=108003 RepID=A0A1V3NB76_9GAMM|nr:DUF6152 family protein [Thioalkalivibrio denitrificans]OOG22310.1 hypothetical protein B1C78_15315 [Thioalkalivibrio denitrificans]
MKILSGLVAALLLATASMSALAHHGWSSYDGEVELTLTGTVVSAVFEWPHAELVINTGEKRWTVVLAPPTRTRNRGLLPERVPEGTEVTVVGHPHRTIEDEIRVERVMVGDETFEMRR